MAGRGSGFVFLLLALAAGFLWIAWHNCRRALMLMRQGDWTRGGTTLLLTVGWPALVVVGWNSLLEGAVPMEWRFPLVLLIIAIAFTIPVVLGIASEMLDRAEGKSGLPVTESPPPALEPDPHAFGLDARYLAPFGPRWAKLPWPLEHARWIAVLVTIPVPALFLDPPQRREALSMVVIFGLFGLFATTFATWVLRGNTAYGRTRPDISDETATTVNLLGAPFLVDVFLLMLYRGASWGLFFGTGALVVLVWIMAGRVWPQGRRAAAYNRLLQEHQRQKLMPPYRPVQPRRRRKG